MKARKKQDKSIAWFKKNVATKKDLEQVRKELSRRLDDHEKKMATKKNLERVYDKLNDHEIRLARIEENMVTKQDLTRIYETQDKMLEILTRNDHELTMTKHTVEEHDNAIRQIKPMLGLA